MCAWEHNLFEITQKDTIKEKKGEKNMHAGLFKSIFTAAFKARLYWISLVFPATQISQI